MDLVCEPSRLCGNVEIPGSKSHTIRAVAIAALAVGDSRIEAPLEAEDTRAAVRVYGALGAQITLEPNYWRIAGAGGELVAPREVLDVANSGTTLRIAMGSCALLQQGAVTLTGDEQIQRRPAGPLGQSLSDLGASVRFLCGNGCALVEVGGRLRGGRTRIEAVTSQFLTSLLINTPLADGDSEIDVPVLNEQPYVQMTLDWLARQGVRVQSEDLRRFHVPGGQRYRPVNRRIPGDFSTATFFLGAGSLGDNEVVLRGLDMTDTQGDKAVVEYVQRMGARLAFEHSAIRVQGAVLQGCEIDLNATPDALPMMAVVGCFARGTTRLVNVPQARIKETDRIAVMRMELERMGARIRELADGLIIEESPLHGAEVDGHGDHRVVMALAVAGTVAKGRTVVHGGEAAAVTYPGFVQALRDLGGHLSY